MDHFNATVYNGALVSTRRGMHVSKSKHQGIRFVNTFAAPTSSGPGPEVRSSAPEPSTTHVRGGFFEFQIEDDFKESGQEDRWRSPRDQKQKVGAKNSKLPSRARAAKLPKSRPTDFPLKNYMGSSMFSDVSSDAEEDDPAYWGLDPLELQSGSGTVPSGSGHVPLTVEEFLAACPPLSAYMPEQWKSHRSMHGAPPLNQKFLHLYLHSTPAQMYPNEELMLYNPMRTSEVFERLSTNLVSMQNAVMTVCIMSSISKGDRSFSELLFYMNKICDMVRSRLQDEYGGDEPAVLEAIATMAIAALFMGQFEHWHMHMRGICSITTRDGLLKPEWGEKPQLRPLLNHPRKADTKGAVYSGSAPYLEFTRFFPPASDVLSPEARQHIGFDVERILVPCGITDIVVESFTGVTTLSLAIHAARGAPGGILFDPHSFVEEYTWNQYQLARYPYQLKDVTGTPSNAPSAYDHASLASQDSGAPTPSSVWDGLFDDTEPFTSDVRVALDTVARISALLYAEELVTEPRTMDPYGFIIGILGEKIRLIMGKMRTRDEEDFVLGVTSEDINYMPPEDGLPHNTAVLRPLLFWACSIVYTVALLVDSEKPHGVAPVDRTPYQDCVVQLLGDASPLSVDGLHESDLALCRLMPAKELVSATRDDQTILKLILLEYEEAQLANIAPFLGV